MLLTRQAIQKVKNEEKRLGYLEENRLKRLEYKRKGEIVPMELIMEKRAIENGGYIHSEMKEEKKKKRIIYGKEHIERYIQIYDMGIIGTDVLKKTGFSACILKYIREEFIKQGRVRILVNGYPRWVKKEK